MFGDRLKIEFVTSGPVGGLNYHVLVVVAGIAYPVNDGTSNIPGLTATVARQIAEGLGVPYRDPHEEPTASVVRQAWKPERSLEEWGVLTAAALDLPKPLTEAEREEARLKQEAESEARYQEGLARTERGAKNLGFASRGDALREMKKQGLSLQEMSNRLKEAGASN